MGTGGNQGASGFGQLEPADLRQLDQENVKLEKLLAERDLEWMCPPKSSDGSRSGRWCFENHWPHLIRCLVYLPSEK